MEGLVAQLVLERLADAHVAHAHHDASDRRILEAVLRDHLDVPPPGVGVLEAHAHGVGARPVEDRTQEAAEKLRVVRVHDLPKRLSRQ